MNIAEILKKCPKGTKLYSPLYGEVELDKVDELDGVQYPVICVTKNGEEEFFASNGRCYPNYPDAECMLFPSRDQRDWNKFGATDQVPDQETQPQLKPFDKVLVRDDNDAEWKCDFFSKISNNGYYDCINSWWSQCIPYEGNEHLLGTTNKPEE